MRNVVRLKPASNPGATLGDMIHRHIRELKQSRDLGESQQKAMEKAARLPIGSVAVSDLNVEHFVAFGRLLASDSTEHSHQAVQPPTVRQYFTYLAGVLDAMKLWRVERVGEIADDFDEAKLWLDKRLHLIGKSRPREQRFSPEQERNVTAYFVDQQARHQRCAARMEVVIPFALTSLKRQGEICRVLWEDFEEDAKMLTVRDMKDPRVKKGNHFRFPLIRGAFEIVKSMPMVDERIFPYNAHSLSQRWHEGLEACGYPEIHFHDLRREGICRMFEEGYAPNEVAAVSGHKNWNTMARVYANKFDPADLHRGPAAARARAT